MFKYIITFISFVLSVLYLPITHAAVPAQCKKIYAAVSENAQTQFYTFNTESQQLFSLGNPTAFSSIEGIALHPDTHILYALSNNHLYQIDGKTAVSTLVGNTHLLQLSGLSFHPDGSLWSWSPEGLVTLDLQTGRGALQQAGKQPVQDLAWNQDGDLLYVTVDDSPLPTALWQQKNNSWESLCTRLPAELKGIEAETAASQLRYAWYENGQLHIHTLDTQTCESLGQQAYSSDVIPDAVAVLDDQFCPSAPAVLSIDNLNIQSTSANTNITAEANTVSTSHQIHLQNLNTGETQISVPETDGSFSLNAFTSPGDVLQLTLEDVYGQRSQALSITVEAQTNPGLPPDPVQVAPPLDPTTIALFSDAVAFIYSGSNPVQTGVTQGTIEAKRVAVLRGKVMGTTGEPLAGVRVSVHKHPEYGQTFSREDGMFDLAINGGGTTVLNYTKTGYLPVQRKAHAAWNEYGWTDDVAMTEIDPLVSHIDLSDTSQVFQVAAGSISEDADGQRQAVVLFPAGTTAEMELPDGSRQVLTQADLHITEYTVGEQGPNAMPGPLPSTTGYTYAVEFSVEAGTSRKC